MHHELFHFYFIFLMISFLFVIWFSQSCLIYIYRYIFSIFTDYKDLTEQDSNSRLVVDEDDNDKLRLEKVKIRILPLGCHLQIL